MDIRILPLAARGPIVALLLCVATPAASQTGVSDDRVSLPDGPGSLDGVGDNAAVNANMGHMETSVPIDLPNGFAGVTPDFTLSYSSGAGSGPVGIGWSMAIPSIERMTSKGLPEYDADDLFVADGSTELVRIDDGEPAVYRARYEGGFVRYAWHNRGAGDAGYWTAEFPSGQVATFGADAGGTAVETARVRSANGVFRYLVTEVRDRRGHHVDYGYRFYGAVPLVDAVAYAHQSDGTPRYRVTFDYEDRPDAISDARGGFNELLDQRLSTIRIFSRDAAIRRYDLDYEDEETAGALSRLAKVTRVGSDGGVYGVTYAFTYSRSLAAVCDGIECEEPLLVNAGNIGASFATGRVNLIDLNGDGLPDAVETPPTGPHRIYLSEMSPEGVHTFAAPFDSAVGNSGTFELSSPYTQVLDVNGDGFTDLINALLGRVLLNRGEGDWSEEVSISGGENLPDFSEDFELDEDGQLQHIRFIDVDADRRIDVIRSDEVGTSMFLNQGELGFVADPSVQDMEAGFADDSTDLADMNGDGLLDPIQIREGQVRYRVHLGRGQWTAWTSILGAPILFEDIPQTSLEDLNGDGVDDIVAVVGGQVKYALNRNALFFTEQQQLTSTRGQPLPIDDGTVVVLYADMNANGSTDVVYIDDAGNVTYLDLFPVRPNLLATIENGIGYTAEVTYGTLVAEQARDQGLGWDDPVPMPTLVVKSLDVYTSASSPEGVVHDLVNYAYESAFYDGVEKQFRGFRRARRSEAGDQGEIVTLEEYDVGAGENRGHFAGKRLREVLREDGQPVRTTTSEYADCPVEGVPPASQLRTPILFACQVAEEVVAQEKRPQAEWATLREEFVTDGYGNVVDENDLGVIAIGGEGCEACTRPEGTTGKPCGQQCLGDELFVHTEFVRPETNSDRWLLNLVTLAQESASAAGPKKEERFFYDGEPFAGLPAGQATHGSLTRQTSLVNAGEAPIAVIRSRFDLHGNLVEGISPAGPASGSHRVRTLFDETGLLMTRTERDVETPDGRVTLAKDYTYDDAFGVVTSATAWYRVGEDPSATRTRWTYDEHGRMVTVKRPGGGLDDAFTEEYTYELGAPYSRIIMRGRSDVDGPLDLETVTCLDGLGRKVQSRTLTAPGQYLVSASSVFNRQGQPVRVYQGSLSGQSACALPGDDVPFSTYAYDAGGREVLVTHPDLGAGGGASTRLTQYFPLATHFYNEDDTDPTSVGLNTPNIVENDGLGRMVVSTRRAASGDDERNEVFYDALGRVAGVVDAGGNVKRQAYDLLDRVVEVEDPDANRVTYAYDAEGALIRTEDARGVVTRRAYDELGRLVEEWDDANRAGTLTTLVYDHDPDCADCELQANRLAVATYASPLGQVRETFEYDVRGNLVVRRQEAQGVTLSVAYTYDNLDRLISTTYPDGQVVTKSYDAANRLVGIDDVISAIDYGALGQMTAWTTPEGVQTAMTYNARAALSTLRATVGGTPVVDLAFERDHSLRVTTVDDRLFTGAQSLSASFLYDALGCLSEVTYDDEELVFTADRLSRMIEKRSTRGAASRAHVGTLAYDVVSPRRVITAGDVPWSYDDAGFATTRGSDAFTFDHNGRMTKIDREGTALVEVARSPTGGRLLTLEGNSVRRHLGDDYEVRDGIGQVRLSVDGNVVALLESPEIATTLYTDADGDGAITAVDAYEMRGNNAQPAMLRSAARRALLSVQGNRTVFINDAQGSTVAVLSNTGEVRERMSYYPFGAVRQATAAVTEFASYTGKEHDTTGYLDFGARVLSPTEGRWLSPDPAFVRLSGTLVESPSEAFSAYAFVVNDPVNFVDRDGRKSGPAHANPAQARSVRQAEPHTVTAAAYSAASSVDVNQGQRQYIPHELSHVTQSQPPVVTQPTVGTRVTQETQAASRGSTAAAASVTSAGVVAAPGPQPAVVAAGPQTSSSSSAAASAPRDVPAGVRSKAAASAKRAIARPNRAGPAAAAAAVTPAGAKGRRKSLVTPKAAARGKAPRPPVQKAARPAPKSSNK